VLDQDAGAVSQSTWQRIARYESALCWLRNPYTRTWVIIRRQKPRLHPLWKR